MGYEIPIIAAYTALLLLLGAAWVGGYLDKYQHAAQDVALGRMGENRVSYGVKTVLGQRVTEDEDVNAVQDGVGTQAGGLVGKGGVGQGVGDMLSKGM